MTALRTRDLVSWTGEIDPDARPWAVGDPDQIYPATIAHIRDVLATRAGTAETPTHPGPTVGLYVAQAEALPAVAWELALRPRETFDADEPDDRAALQLRAQALEIARLWFTEALHASENHAPIALKLVKRPAWRLL